MPRRQAKDRHKGTFQGPKGLIRTTSPMSNQQPVDCVYGRIGASMHGEVQKRVEMKSSMWHYDANNDDFTPYES
ncbi:hypothetical protein E4U19_000184 [Claviceps sp. Clav32 group G5]|nr:hypothetical protein E4U19_000184 [Claviceps sp. Clav32 group G5]KAG6047461.1 hypothetical protein E4U39_000468 [Claviceps sp. Clav50 group G5]